MNLNRKQYNVLITVEDGDPLPPQAQPILTELHSLNLVTSANLQNTTLTWRGGLQLDGYEKMTTIEQFKKDND